MKTRYSLPLWALLSLFLLLLALHFALPYVIRDYLNDKMAHMGDYRGQIAEVSLAWWRGAYQVKGLEIVKVDGKVPVPFVDAPILDLSVSWRSLWYDQAIVGRAIFEHPELNFVDGGTPQETQTGEGVNWRQQLEELLPITLNEVRVVDGRVAFRNFESNPQVNLQTTAVNASLYNLTNVADEQGKRVAHFEGKAKILGQAPLETAAKFDPFGKMEDFELRLRITEVELKRLNDFSRAYGRFDFAAGSGDLVIEAQAVDSQLSGYIKPLLRDVEVFDWKQDVEREDKGLLRSFWEALVAAVKRC